ncbi:periplasmic binding protein-like II [Anaeromyces robustus]|uniref:Periplasmic binding protein-like II n=1 Tax=Anaeromyces robustus TaxID=1754192 RepID=A0A1Y1XCA1_9FUNG|nr:periplasmic binding protein-like II [Anaeromyces robustus]|eukprot:ORX82994.1 periplasmic binding protein-like II [Anaeromyces robustus]
MKFIFIVILLFQYIIWNECKNINIKAVSLLYTGDEEFFSVLENDFNKYSEENNLGINISFVFYTVENSTLFASDYSGTIQYLLNKKSTKYDVIFYDVMYSPRFASYFIDLKDYLPKDHIDIYSKGIAPNICTYNGKWVGLPIRINFSVLYCNKILLEKYGKDIPKTCDEFIDTGKYILNKEKEGNNTLIGYNALFPDFEVSLISAMETIFSFRKSVNSPMPKYDSKEAIDALNKLKQMKDELESNEAFQSDYYELATNLYNGKSIYAKWWYYDLFEDKYVKIPIVGNKEGISASSVGGLNIGINKYISNENLKASIEYLKFITSKDFQKKLLMKKLIFSSIDSLYDDEEVCKYESYQIFKKMQFIPRPSLVNYDDYSFKFRNHLKKFLYSDKSAEETLYNIMNISKIFNISIFSTSIPIGICVLVICIIMLSSLIFLFKENFNPFFKYLSVDFWIIFVFGSIIILNTAYTKLGELSSFKCRLTVIFFFFGLSLNYIPILYKLIIYFPGESNFSEWVKNHKYIYLAICLLVEIILIGLSFIYKFDIYDVLVNGGQNFQICKMNNTFGKIMFGIMVTYKFTIIFVMLIYIFIEWNINESFYEVRFIVMFLYIDILSFILLFLFDIIIIKNYRSYFIIYTCILIIISISNYGFLYGFRLFCGFLNKKNLKMAFIQNVNKNFINNEIDQVTTETNIGELTSITATNNNISNNNNNNIINNNHENKCSKVNLNAVAYVFGGEYELFNSLEKYFNKYSEENNLDINVSFVYYTIENSTVYAADYSSTIEHILKKKSDKYDIIFYDVMYSPRFSPHFIDLKEYLPKDHIDMYSTGVIPELCTYNGKWVGLTIELRFSVIYCNKKLLKKYEKELPKTWDDLLDIGKYILKMEKNNENNLVGYNGLFPDSETSLVSTIEAIYSFRKSVDSLMPEYDSKEAIDALNKIKQIKDELESNEAFQSGEYGAVMNLLTENAIFLKWWYYYNLNDEGFIKIPIVGNKEGISASSVGGLNVGINKYISNENINASVKFIKYITSKEYQKESLMRKENFSAINSLYDDKEVCKIVDCELFKKMQFIARPPVVNYDDYSFNFRNYLKSFLYGNESPEKTLNNITNLTKTYIISLDSIGTFFFIITILIAFLITLSIAFIFIEKYKLVFNFLNRDLWICFFLGLMVNISYIITEYGEITNLKCKIKPLILSIGFNLMYTPFLYKLIVNFQDTNKYFDFIENHCYLFITFINTLDIILNMILFMSPVELHYKGIINEQKFKYCDINNSFGIIIFSLILTEKVIILLTILLFIFMEWNITATKRNIRLLTATIYIDIITYKVIKLYLKSINSTDDNNNINTDNQNIDNIKSSINDDNNNINTDYQNIDNIKSNINNKSKKFGFWKILSYHYSTQSRECWSTVSPTFKTTQTTQNQYQSSNSNILN